MSPSRPKGLRIVLGARAIVVLGETVRVLPVDLAEAGGDIAMAQAFGKCLDESAARSVEILLSSSLVDFVVMAGLEHWLADGDLQALGRSRLAAFLGNDQGQREVRVVREGFGVQCLVFSAAKKCLEIVRTETAARRIALLRITPLATRILASSARELKGKSPTAFWIEEKDALWIGVRGEGSWLSTRSLPASVLQHASRRDLLQREILAAGLVRVERICCAFVGTEPANEWGSAATDISDCWQTKKGRISAAGMDFLGKPRRTFGWALLVTAVGALAATAFIWQQDMETHAIASEKLLQRIQIEFKAAEKEERERAALAADYDRAMAAFRVQIIPWGELFSALNRCGGEAVGLTNFKADAMDGSLTMDGEARSFDTVQEFADALGKEPLFQRARIVSLLPSIDAGVDRVKFSVELTWSSGASREKLPEQ